LDTRDSTCWYSDGPADKQWYQLDFGRAVVPTQVRLMFQAGFVGTSCRILAYVNDKWTSVHDMEVQDVHAMQVASWNSEALPCTKLRLELEEFTDFYGRVTIYQLQVWGKECLDK
jgi:hypothetical protein